MRKLLLLLLAAPLCAQTLTQHTIQTKDYNDARYSQLAQITTLAQLQAAVTACGSSPCLIQVGSSISVTSNTTVPSNVVLSFVNQGALPNTFGTTLTINGPIVAGQSTIFGTTGTVVLGTANSLVPCEWFGAVGDWTGSSGTDNAVPLQACFNAITNGQASLRGQYKTTVGLTITKSHVGIKGIATGYSAPSLYPTPSPSAIVLTTPTGSVVSVSGTNASNNIAFGKFEDFSVIRSVAPSVGQSANGIAFSFVYGVFVNRVTAQDHNAGFYFHGLGSQGIGYIDNCVSINGYNGVTETGGSSIAGFEVDSTGAVTNNSLRIRNSFAVSNPGMTGVTSYGLYVVGSATHDLMVDHFETATVGYGAYINSTTSGFTDSSDIHLINMIHDGCTVSCTYVYGAQGSVEIAGGWYYRQSSASANIDIESSSHVQVSGTMLYAPAGSGPQILAQNSGGVNIKGNDFGTSVAAAVSFVNTSASKIVNNVANGTTATSIISLATTSTGNVVADNNLNGTATNGILIDATSNATGIETNQIGLASIGTVTNLVTDASNNALTPIAAGTSSGATTVKAFVGTGTLTYTSITNGTAQSQTLTITGAKVANKGVFCAPQAGLGTGQFNYAAYVLSANTVTVSISNNGASSATPNAVTWGCTVLQ